MLKELLLISALTFTPMVDSETPTEPTTGETTEDDTTTTEEESFDFEAFLAKYLDSQTVANIMLVLGYVVIIIKAITAVKNAKKSTKTSNAELTAEILAELKKTVSEEVLTQITPVLTSVLSTCTNLKEVLAVLSRVMVLSQNNDKGQNANAILDCIASLGVVDKSVIADTRESAEDTKETQEKAVEDTNKAVEQIIADTTENDGTSI